MTSDICQKKLSIGNVLNLNIYKDGAATDVPVEVGKTMYFDENFGIDKTKTEAILKAITAPTFSAGDGSCDNVALEVHLKVMF